ncbi:MAG: neutral/alkaline non-lysosomal ceramidase N-terminal domain-containing protein, partial [Nannocystaceae bacterium]
MDHSVLGPRRRRLLTTRRLHPKRGGRAAMLLATLWFYVAALLGCATIETKTATPLPRTGSGTLLVGAKKSDLTPIPGYPMGGHAIGGRYGLGAMGPLHVRALYLEDPTGTPLILVALDVWAVSPGLRDMVVQLLQDSHGLTHIGPDHVVLSASHTHHSSAAFATENALNLGGGVSPSFSRVLFDRTAARIAQAIADAHDLRRPAAVHHGAKPIQNYARNRSLTPFLDNAEASTILAQNPFPPSCTLPQLPPYRDAPVPESC